MCVAIAGFFVRSLFFKEDKSEFLIGEATHGHYQIELACSSCHLEPFGGKEILQNACENCHAQELEIAQDSHPKKKFTDPRNANRLAGLDARYCVSCHTEHQEEQTHAMGLTLPEDYCYHCHSDVAEERESHQDLAFNSCASAGCHNYHDNRALYENFLVKNANQDWLSAIAAMPPLNGASASAHAHVKPVNTSSQIQSQVAKHSDIQQSFLHTRHGEANVECAHCHSSETQTWLQSPGVAQCQSCHQHEAEGFLASKHGMRLATSTLDAMTPAQSKGQFHTDAGDKHQNCSACHSAHEFDTQTAAVESCLGCHADDHSQAYLSSPHGQQWADKTLLDNRQKVTCATCHLPRLETDQTDENGQAIVRVQHNQNDTLRPNEKMIRPVCMQCHSLEFSIDALADPQLINNNFNGQPSEHIPSIDWALKRVSE